MKKLHNLKRDMMRFIFALVLCLILDAVYITLLVTMLNSHILIIIFWIIAVLFYVSLTIWTIFILVHSIIDYNKQLDIVLSNINKILNLEEKDSNDKT